MSSTTSARCVPSRTTSVASADQSASTSRDSTGARVEIVSCSRRARSVPEIRAWTTRSPASTCTRSRRVAGERGEQQRGIHRGVQPRCVADPAGAGARGVEHDDHPAVLLGLPGAHDEVLAPGGGAPVDGAHVVAVDVVAQAVELGALAADAHRGTPVELRAARASRLGRCLREGNGVQRPDRPGHRDATAAARPGPAARATRTVTRSATPVAAPGRAPGGW